MKIIGLACLALLAVQLRINAQQLVPLDKSLEKLNPVNVFPLNPEKTYNFNDRNKKDRPSEFTVKMLADSVRLFTAEVTVAGKGYNDVQVEWRSQLKIKKGDILLARMAMRGVYAKQESGEAMLNFAVTDARPNGERSVIVDLSIGPDWKTIDIPFIAASDILPNNGKITIGLGALAQKVEIAGIAVLNFGNKASLAQLPATRFTYEGREKDAKWRKDALKRIEKIRTAPLQIKVVDAAGNAVEGVNVKARMIQSSFIWGTAVNEAELADNLPTSEQYKTLLKELFNTVVIENGFKWERWAGIPARKVQTLKAFEWLDQQGFRQRGHNLVWPGWKFAPKFAKGMAEKDSAAFRKLIEDDIRERMAITKGKVIAWDVINELMHEHDFFPYLPKDVVGQWYKLARSLDPKAQLFINEYAMLNGKYSPKNIEKYIELVDNYRKEGVPIDAMGVQGHVGRQPRNPVDVISDLDLFTPIGVPIQITEFDVNTTDEELQADYTRDFLIACYSHPAITGFIMWGFWQGKHWKPDAAMFRTDFTPKPNAAVWRDLVNKQWKTSFEASTNAKGKVASRGHFGTYDVELSKDGKVVKQQYQLTKNAPALEIKW